MTFVESIRTCMLTKVVNTSDRAPRSEFWWFILASAIFNAVGGVVAFIPFIGAIIYLVLSFWIFIATITATVRRLHDINRSGWWILLPWLGLGVMMMVTISVVGLGGAPDYVFERYVALTGIVTLVLYLVILIFLIKKGTDGSNKYGPDPLQPLNPFGANGPQGFGPQGFGPQGFGPYQGPQGGPWQQGQGAPWNQQGPFGPNNGQGYGAPNGPGYDPQGQWQQGNTQGQWQQGNPNDYAKWQQGQPQGPWQQGNPNDYAQWQQNQQGGPWQQGSSDDYAAQSPKPNQGQAPNDATFAENSANAQGQRFYQDAEPGMYTPPHQEPKAEDLWSNKDK